MIKSIPAPAQQGIDYMAPQGFVRFLMLPAKDTDMQWVKAARIAANKSYWNDPYAKPYAQDPLTKAEAEAYAQTLVNSITKDDQIDKSEIGKGLNDFDMGKARDEVIEADEFSDKATTAVDKKFARAKLAELKELRAVIKDGYYEDNKQNLYWGKEPPK